MKIFISYARLNMTTAEALVRDLHALGHQAFYDQDLTGGQRWWDTLLDQIQAADAFVPVLSDEYRESQACRVEAEWADALHVSFVPVITDQQLPGMYDPIIAEANWVSYDPADRDALAELAKSVSAVTKRSLPDPLPARPAIPLSYLVMMEREIRGEDELGRHRQLSIVSDLRSKLGTRESSGARELLQALRERPDVTYEVATTVDALLATPDPVEPEPAPASQPEPVDLAAVPSTTPASEPVARSRPPAPYVVGATPPQPAAAGDPAPAPGSRLAMILAAAGGVAAFLAFSLVPWVVTLNSDSRTWYGFSVVVSYPDRSDTVDLAGWVIGLVFCAAIAAVVLVVAATQFRVVSSGLRIAAGVGAGLATILGFATPTASPRETRPCTRQPGRGCSPSAWCCSSWCSPVRRWVGHGRPGDGCAGASCSARVGFAGVSRPLGRTVRRGRLVPAVPPAPSRGDQDRAGHGPDDAARPQVEAVTGQQADQQPADERADQAGDERHRPVDAGRSLAEDQLGAPPTSIPNRIRAMMSTHGA